MDWMRRQDIKEESPETPTALTPDEPDECYFEEDTSIDEGMVRDSRGYCHSFIQTRASFENSPRAACIYKNVVTYLFLGV